MAYQVATGAQVAVHLYLHIRSTDWWPCMQMLKTTAADPVCAGHTLEVSIGVRKPCIGGCRRNVKREKNRLEKCTLLAATAVPRTAATAAVQLTISADGGR